MKLSVQPLFTLLFVCIRMVAQEPVYNDIVINEILFNPATDGYDYVEGYNRSKQMIRLDELLIATRNVTGDIASVKAVSRLPATIQPGSYFVITANEKWLKQNYSTDSLINIIQVSSLPSFPDDDGIVILLRRQDSVIIDEVHYDKSWHFPLLNDVSGVALERISFEMKSEDKNNWTSASSSSGYGTPGVQNSQYADEIIAEGEAAVTPRIFSPDNDGTDDFTFLSLNMKEQGYAANTIVYDISGRRVKYLVKNQLLGIHNKFRWEGNDDHSQKLPVGLYIFITEVFNLQGDKSKFRNLVVLSRRN